MSATGHDLFALVPVGVNPEDVFRKLYPDYDGAPLVVFCLVRAECFRNLFAKGKVFLTPEKKAQCEDIYAVYPLRVAKPAAIKAISKALDDVPFDRLIKLTKAFADEVEKWGPQSKKFIPYPATWFNRRQFEDDPITWKRDSNEKTGQKHEGGFV